MSREKRTRPSVGALGRAVETGSAMQADTTSKPQFTPNGPGGQRKVADLLSHGRENAIPRRELEKLTGLDGRTVRLMIERERREGRPILADNATVIGDATIGRDCSIWFSAVVRGDVNKITIGDRVNIQDGAVIHTLYQRSVTEIGNDVSIGHNANVHGAKIEDKCLIGMGATVLDHAVVGTGSIVAANSLVLTGTVIEPGSVYAGVPARRVKGVTPEQVRDIIERTARDYMMYASWYKE